MEKLEKRSYHQETIDWAEKIAKRFGFATETIFGIYDDMYRKSRFYAKERTVSFIALYLEGKEEVPNDRNDGSKADNV